MFVIISLFNRYIYSLLAILGLSLSSMPLYAQINTHSDELGYLAGIYNYFGDLNTSTSFKVARPAANLYYRHNFDSRIAWRSSIGYGYIYGNDNLSSDYYQHLRNLNFYSDIKEASTMIEFNFLDYTPTGKKHRFTPYMSAGFCLFHFDPKTSLNGTVYELQQLGTEGQYVPNANTPAPYRLTSTAFLIGGGFKWRIGRSTCLTIDATQHKTSTKYLDDVSGNYVEGDVLTTSASQNAIATKLLADRSYQVSPTGQDVFTNGKERGNGRKDSYLFIGVGLSFTFGRYRCPFQE